MEEKRRIITIKSLWERIIKFLFGEETQSNNKDYEQNDKYSEDYECIDKINFTAIFSNKLANYTASQSKVFIVEDNKRCVYLNNILKSVTKKLKKITARTFGTGGIILAPYVNNGKLLFNMVSQNRISINKVDGDKTIDATILADIKTINNFAASKKYYRWTNYKIINNNCIITQKYTDENGNEISPIKEWETIKNQIMITNCDRVLWGYIKSPVDNRKINDLYGVPITYGCESTIEEIRECLKQIVREFKLKETFVGVDFTLFKDKNKLSSSGLYKKFDGTKDDFWEVFDPAIRDSSYYSRLQELYSRLEKEIGTSKGILTEPNTQNATATEIKRSLYDTFTIVDDMRTNIETGIEDFIYSCNAIANAFNLSTSGDYEIKYDWDYSLLEDSQETFNQLQNGVSKGVVKKSELRQYMYPNETVEEAESIINEIKKQNPTTKDLLGE